MGIVTRHFNILFYVVAPLSTFDLLIPSGGAIRIEKRSAEEDACPGIDMVGILFASCPMT